MCELVGGPCLAAQQHVGVPRPILADLAPEICGVWSQGFGVRGGRKWRLLVIRGGRWRGGEGKREGGMGGEVWRKRGRAGV